MDRATLVSAWAAILLLSCSPPPKPSVTPAAQALAGRAPAAPAPLPAPSAADDLDLAERMIEQALHTSSAAERQASFDIALLALERATGAAPQAIALSGLRAQLIDESTLVAGALSEPEGRAYAVALRLEPLDSGAEQARARPFRLLGSGAQPPDIAVGKSGGVVVSYQGRASVYPTLQGEARAIPGGLRYDVARDAAVIANEDSVEIVNARSGEVVVPKTSVTLTRAALEGAGKTEDERFWIACAAAGADASGVVVVDLEARRVTVNLPSATRCVVDPARSQLVVLQPPDAATAHASVDVIPLDGSPSARLALPQASAVGGSTLRYDASRGGAFAGFKVTSFIDLEKRRVLSVAPPPTLVGPPGLKSVPVGHAGAHPEDVAPLAPLASLPRRIIQPHFDTPHAWQENGLKSFDGKTVAAFTEGPDSEEPLVELVTADAATLKVRHRTNVGFGVNWLTAHFLDNRYLIAQSYPSYSLYDTITGELLARPELDDCAGAVPRFDHYFLCGPTLWTVAPDPKKYLKDRRVDLGLANGLPWRGKAPLRELVQRGGEEGTLRFTAEGKVVLHGMAAPSWLHCRFGDRLAPFAVCQRRLQEGASDAGP